MAAVCRVASHASTVGSDSLWTLTDRHNTRAGMTDDKGSDPSATTNGRPRQGSALDRRKVALKANMARRKDQARARAALNDGVDEAEQDKTGQDPMGE